MMKADNSTPATAPSPTTVQVAVRVRPFNLREKDKLAEYGVGCCVQMLKPHDGEVKLISPDGVEHVTKDGDVSTERVFNFDYAYWSHDGFEIDESSGRTVPKDVYDGKGGVEYVDQERVFADLGLPVLKGSLEGRDACIFAYGQTGSGKSHSVFGPAHDPGIIPKAGMALFELGEQNNDIVMHVNISVLEIYNEVIRDLLNFDSPKKTIAPQRDPGLRIVEKPTGIEVLERKEIPVASYAEVEQLMDAAMSQRKT